MDIDLTKRQRKKRQLLKEFASLEKKLSPNHIIWWNSLTIKAKYSLLFRWKMFKIFRKSKKNKPKISHFLKTYKSSYRPITELQRNAIIDNLFQQEK